MLLTSIPVCSAEVSSDDFFAENVRKYQSYGFEYENTTGISDEMFFGVWENDEWITKPYFNYDEYDALSAVEEAAKVGNYDLCKEEILKYYQEVLPKYNVEIKDRRTNSQHKMWAETMAYNMQKMTNPIGRIDLESDAKWFDLDCTTYVSNVVSNASTSEFTFGISALEKDGFTARFKSKQSENGNAPYLLMVVNGVEKRYDAADDVTVIAGDNKTNNYGLDEFLYAEESVSTIGTTHKFDDYTKKSLLKFDFSDLSAEDEVTSARLYLYGDYIKSDNPAEGEESINYKYVYVYKSGEGGWDEERLTWNDLTVSEAISFDREKGATAVTPSPLTDMYDWRAYVHNIKEETEAIVSLYHYTKNEDYAYAAIRYALDVAEKSTNYDESYWNGCLLLHIGVRNKTLLEFLHSTVGSVHMTPEIFTLFLKFYWKTMEHISMNWRRGYELINQGIVSISYSVPTAFCFMEFTRATDPIEGKNESGEELAFYYGGWIKTLLKRAEALADVTINPDGSLVDIPYSYMYYTLDYFINLPGNCAKYSDEANDYFSQNYWDRIEKAIDFTIAKLSPILGSWQVGDEVGWQNTASISGYLNKYLGVLPEHSRAIYVTSERKEGEQPPFNTFYNDTMKVAVMRSSWDENAVALYIDADDGETHGHADDLSANVFAYGNYLLIDGMTYSYDPNNAYNIYGNSPKAHNTIEINSTSQISRLTYGFDVAIDALGEEVYFAKGQSRGLDGRGDIHPEDRETNEVYDYVRAETKTYSEHNALNYDFKQWRSVLFIKPGYFIVTDYIDPQDKDVFNVIEDSNAEMVLNPADDGKSCTITFDLSESYDIDTVKIGEICGQDPYKTCGEEVTIEVGRATDGSTEWKTVLPYGRLKTGFKEAQNFYSEGEIITSEFLFKTQETADKIRITLSQKDAEELLEFNIAGVEAYGKKSADSSTTTDINTYKQNWHFLPEAKISLDGNNNTSTNFDGKANIIVAPVNQNDNMVATLEDGLSWTANNSSVDGIPTKGSRYTKNLEGIVTFNTVLYPVRPNETANVSTKKLNLDVADDVANAFSATINDSDSGNKSISYYTLFKESERAEREFGSFSSDGSVAFIEKGTKGYETLVLKNGSSIKEDDINIIFSEKQIEDLGVSLNNSAGTVELSAENGVDLDSLTVYAGDMDEVLSVTLNGEEVSFNQSGRYIYFSEDPIIDDSNYEEEEDDEDDEKGSSGGGHSSGGGSTGISSGAGKGGSTGISFGGSSNTDTKEDLLSEKYRAELLNHWGKNEITEMIEKGVVKGDGNSLNLSDNVTRAEFITMLLRGFNIETVKYKGGFSDVSAESWYADFMETAFNLGIISGDGDGKMRPDDKITREEMAKIIVSYIKPEAKEEAVISDKDEISPWAIESVETAVSAKLMQGVGEGKFSPKANTKREEAIVVLYRALIR